jgi:hypothetical protein
MWTCATSTDERTKSKIRTISSSESLLPPLFGACTSRGRVVEIQCFDWTIHNSNLRYNIYISGSGCLSNLMAMYPCEPCADGRDLDEIIFGFSHSKKNFFVSSLTILAF